MTAVKENSAQLCTACSFLQPSPDARLSSRIRELCRIPVLKRLEIRQILGMEDLLQTTQDKSLVYEDCADGNGELASKIEPQRRILYCAPGNHFDENLMTEISIPGNYHIAKVNNISECLALLKEKAFDVIITDINLRGVTKDDVIGQFKRLAHRTPIVIITDKKCDKLEVEYLDMGIDSVIGKPFHPSLVLARIRTLIRWRTQSAFSTYQIGPFKFKPDLKRLIQPDEDDIKLTDKEAKILHYLLRRRGDVVSRADLLQHVWGYHKAANTHTVETHIYRLRKKMGVCKKSNDVLVTETNGYRIPVAV